MEKIQSVRGMNDTVPSQSAAWQFLEKQLRDLVYAYAYEEIRTPLLEQTVLFKRTIGEVTDIVEKEMYVFQDRNGDSLALRPEGTAGCVRSLIEHNLLRSLPQKVWYMGPMYRHERPQRGRFRQFYQFGMEAFGVDTPDIEVEMLLLLSQLWRKLGLDQKVELQINSLGTAEVRQRYKAALQAYFSPFLGMLSPEEQNRLQNNPLRLLDSKNPELVELIQKAPKILDYLDEDTLKHWLELLTLLSAVGIKFHINPCLVRGLDYYTKTVYEWVTTELGAQGTVCAGGRYDGLVQQLGGPEMPATGFAMGLERILDLMSVHGINAPIASPNIYIIQQGDAAISVALRLAEEIRKEFPAWQVMQQLGEASIKNQFKRADKSNAEIALVIAENELQTDTVTVKYLRKDYPQQVLPRNELITYLKTMTKE